MNQFLKKHSALQFTLLFLALLWGCKKDFALVSPESHSAHFPITIAEAQDWFANRPVVSSLTDAEKKIIVPVNPSWDKALLGYAQSGREIIMVPLQGDSLITKEHDKQANIVMLISKDSINAIEGQLLMYRADSAYFAAHSNNLSLADFSGEFLFFDLDYNYQYGCVTANGVPTERIDTVTVTMKDEGELEDRGNGTADCIAYSELNVYCWTVRECCPFNGVDCVVWVETYIDCDFISGGGGSGGGGSGGGSGGGGGIGGIGGNGGTLPPPNFVTILTNNIPISVFLANGGVLPPGFTTELAKQLQELHQQNALSLDQYNHLLANPNLIPLLLDFCVEHPADNNSTEIPTTINEPSPPLVEGQFCDAFKKIVFDFELNAQQAKWLAANTELLTPFLNYTLNNPFIVQRIINLGINNVSLNVNKVEYLLQHLDVLEQFEQWLSDFDVREGDKELIDRILTYKTTNSEQDIVAAQNFLAAEIERVFQEQNMSFPTDPTTWTPDYWEILWELIIIIAPELIPGIDTAVELMDAIQAANDGNWWQSSLSLAGAILTLTPWDKIKDSYKLAKAIGRANRWFDLIKRCSFFNAEMAFGLRHLLNKELKNPHIFRYSAGHLPTLNPAIEIAGGADELLFDVYKKVHDEGLASTLQVGGASQLIEFTLHGLPMRGRVIKIFDPSTGITRIEVSDFWVP